MQKYYNMMFVYLAILITIVLLSQRADAFQIAILEDIDQRYKNIVFRINQQQNLWVSKHSHGQFNQTRDQQSKHIGNMQNSTQSDLNDTKENMNQNRTEQLKNQSYDKLPSHFQFKKKYQTFIYPYEVYLIEDQSHQLLEQSFIGLMKKIQNHYNQFHLGMNNTQNNTVTSSISLNDDENQIEHQSKQQNLTQNLNTTKEKPNKWETNHLNPPPFLMFMKISKCSNENSCKLLKNLPKNIVITPSKLNQYLKIHKISQSDFVIESIIRNTNLQTLINGLETSNISNSNETTENNSIKSEKTSENDKNKGYSSNVWLYNLNINNHIFYKMNGKESLIRGYERLMVGHKVIQIQNQNQSWDIAFNGSAFRLINHKKELFPQYIQNNHSNVIQIKNGAEERLIQPKFNNFIPIIRDKIHIPSKLKIPTLSSNPQTKTQFKKQKVQYVNTFQIVQYGINQNYQNKPYQIVFFTQEYYNPLINLFEGYPSLEKKNQLRKYQMVNSLQISFRRNLIGSDKNGNFHLYYHQYKNQTQKLIKIFKSTLKQLSFIEQIEHTCLPYKMLRDHEDYKIEWGNINIVEIGHEKMCNEDREYLVYLQQKSSFTFDKKKLDINQMLAWKNQSKFSRRRNQNQYSLIIKQIKSMSPYSSNSFYNILTTTREEKELTCKVSIGNKSIVMQRENIFISKLNDEYLVICAQQGYQNQTDEHDTICKIVNTQCQQIYTFPLYLSEHIERASVKGNYQLRWSLKQCQLYQYQTQISMSLFSNFSNQSQKYEQQQTYIKLYIDKHKLEQYLNQSMSQQNNATAQQNTIVYLMEDENTIHGQLMTEKRLNSTNQTYLSFINSFIHSNMTFGALQFNHTDFSAEILARDQDYRSNSQQNNTNISDNHLYSQFLTTQWQLNLRDQANINEEQLQLFENNTYFKYEDYQNRTRYRYLYGSKLMESKLNPIFNLFLGDDVESTEIQESNCKLQWDQRKLIDVEPYQNQISSEGYRVRRLLGIKFKNQSSQQKNNTQTKEWQICRLSIDTGHQNLVISPDIPESEIKKPYKIFRCSVQNSSLTSKCSYSEQKIDNNLVLNSNAKSILFIVNNGQVYNLSIQDLSSMQMDKITQSFVIMFICLLIVFLTFLSMFMCRRICMLGRLYLGLMESEDEPRFRYPLNCIELRLKLKRMKKLGIIRQINQKKNHFQEMDQNQLHIETDDCVFCLQQKQSQQKIMETYCKHSYHKECFSEWVRQQSSLLSCPMCKRKLNFQGLNRYLEEGGKSQIHIL